MEEEEGVGVGCYTLCVGREEWDTARKGNAARGFLFTYIIAQLPFPRIYRFPPNFRTLTPLGLRSRGATGSDRAGRGQSTNQPTEMGCGIAQTNRRCRMRSGGPLVRWSGLVDHTG